MKKFKAFTSAILCTAILLTSCASNQDSQVNYNYENLKITPITDENKSFDDIFEFEDDLDIVSSENVSKYEESFFAIDTINTIILYVEDQETFNEYIKLAQATVNEYEMVLSKTIEGSFPYELNKNKTYNLANHPYKSQILYLLGKSIFYNELSSGNFDITIEPLVELWGFGSDNQGDVPTDEEILAALEKVDSDYISIDGDVVTLKNDATIDFGAIAKGYIGDKTKEILIENGVKSGLLNLGGNIITIGLKPDGDMWKVGVQDPNSKRGDSLGLVVVENKSVVTSGIYERNFTKDGVLYHHIISPKTGKPATTNISAAAVVCDASIDGDALATAIVLLGIEEGLNLLDSFDNIHGVIIDKDLNKYFSDGFVENYNYTDLK